MNATNSTHPSFDQVKTSTVLTVETLAGWTVKRHNESGAYSSSNSPAQSVQPTQRTLTRIEQ